MLEINSSESTALSLSTSSSSYSSSSFSLTDPTQQPLNLIKQGKRPLPNNKPLSPVGQIQLDHSSPKKQKLNKESAVNPSEANQFICFICATSYLPESETNNPKNTFCTNC